MGAESAEGGVIGADDEFRDLGVVADKGEVGDMDVVSVGIVFFFRDGADGVFAGGEYRDG